MNCFKLCTSLLVACAASFQPGWAAEHHSGHGGASSGGGSASQCVKARIERFVPAPLASVAPGSPFSFYVFNIDKPEQVSVTVKKIEVDFNAEYRDPFFVIKGQLPASLVNTHARIDVKVTAKSSHCEEQKGWLIKITDR